MPGHSEEERLEVGLCNLRALLLQYRNTLFTQ